MSGVTGTVARRLAVLGVALALDLALGEPPSRLHPVVWIGRLIGWFEKKSFTHDPCPVTRERGADGGIGDTCALASGAVMALAVPAVSAGGSPGIGGSWRTAGAGRPGEAEGRSSLARDVEPVSG